MQVPHEHIAVRAYFLWVAQGKPAGQDERIWLDAQAIERKEYHPNHQKPFIAVIHH